jgi:hypothetical protein
MTSILNSELFADWLSMSIVGIVLWLCGYLDRRVLYPISIPQWLAWITGKPQAIDKKVYLYSFALQLLGFLIFAMVTVLALMGISHEARVFWFRVGIVASFLLVGLFVAFYRLVR